MLSIQPPRPANPSSSSSSSFSSSSFSSQKCTPHLLPCRIHHSGPVNASPRYWNPQPAKDGQKQEAYFRGRKLEGREVRVPEGWRGVVVREGEAVRRREGGVDLDVDDGDEEEEVGVLEEVGAFDGIVVWGHEGVVDGDDRFVRGVEEWVGFAEAMHGIASEGEQEGGKKP